MKHKKILSVIAALSITVLFAVTAMAAENILENGDFSNGTAGWELQKGQNYSPIFPNDIKMEVVQDENGDNVLHVYDRQTIDEDEYDEDNVNWKDYLYQAAVHKLDHPPCQYKASFRMKLEDPDATATATLSVKAISGMAEHEIASGEVSGSGWMTIETKFDSFPMEDGFAYCISINTMDNFYVDDISIAKIDDPSYTGAELHTKCANLGVVNGTGDYSDTQATMFGVYVFNSGVASAAMDYLNATVTTSNGEIQEFSYHIDPEITLGQDASIAFSVIVDGLGDENATMTAEIIETQKPWGA